MAQVSVNDAPSTAQPRPGRRRKSRALILFSAAAISLALAWFVVLPWLLRNRVQAVLREAGVGDVRFDVAEATPWGSTLTSVEAGDQAALGIERLRIQYSPLDLWNERLHALRIRGGRLELRVVDGRVDFGPLTAFLLRKDRPTTSRASGESGGAGPTLPLERIELVESTLVFQTDRSAVQIPVDVTVENRSRHELLIVAHAGPSRNLRFEAAVDLAASQATFEGSAEPGWTLLTVRSIWPDAGVTVDGQLQLSGALHWGDKTAGGRLRLEAAAAGNADKLADAQLNVAGGVLEVAGDLGPGGGLLVNLSNGSLAGEMYAASGVSATVAFSSLSPPQTPPRQQLTVAELEVGGVKLTSGQMEFQMSTAGSINVNRMAWTAFGGHVSAIDFIVQPGQPVAVTLHAREIELKDLLETFANDKATGEGKLSGELPIILDGGNVKFGDGRAVALERGRLQIKDAAALAPAAESAAAAAQSPSQSEQIKRNIVEALSDFEYDRLTARLDDNDGNGLSAFVRLSGHGRSGARQALDYDLRIHGLDGLLRSYLGVRRSMSEAEDSGKAEQK